jgi:ferredoxin
MKPPVVPIDVFTLVVEPKGWTIEAHTAITLLEAAELAGVRLPSSCRNGTCRTCMCRMTSGKVRYEIAWPGLSAEEKQDGYILPCVAHPDSDITLEVPLARAEP